MPPNATNNIVRRRSCRLIGKKVIQKHEAKCKIEKEIYENDKNNNNNNNSNYKEAIKIPIVKKIKIEVEDNNNVVDSKEIYKVKPETKIKTKAHVDDVTQTNKIAPTPDGYLEADLDELDLERTLLGGQSFRWSREISSDNYLIFTGIVLNHVFKIWRISDNRIAFKKVNKDYIKSSMNNGTSSILTGAPILEEILKDYFQLQYNLKELYKQWSLKDEHLAKCSKQYKGFRILRQDPVENVFSFICATNNNIKRISQMVEKLCKRYGDILDSRDDEPVKSIYDSYHSFPPVERLAQEDVFQCLRYELGFGYRAKFICETAKELLKLSSQSVTIKDIKTDSDRDYLETSTSNEKEDKSTDDKIEPQKQYSCPRDYLLSLRKLPYQSTCKQLMKFQGIGRKVADCICLMSMDHLNSVPIDCHIYEIVCRNYMPNLRQERKTLTDSVHDLIGDYFKDLHGDLAGWSTSVLFIAELKHLKQSEDGQGKDSKSKATTKKRKKA